MVHGGASSRSYKEERLEQSSGCRYRKSKQVPNTIEFLEKGKYTRSLDVQVPFGDPPVERDIVSGNNTVLAWTMIKEEDWNVCSRLSRFRVIQLMNGTLLAKELNIIQPFHRGM
jgi:hypothetical protein